MIEPKFKPGEEVWVPNLGPRVVQSMVTCYRFSANGALWLEDELRPYTRPLEVGDPVRRKWCNTRGVIRLIENGAACWVDNTSGQLNLSSLSNLEREVVKS
jgi:hypothetical protein